MPTTIPAPMTEEQAVSYFDEMYPKEPTQLLYGAWIYPLTVTVESKFCRVLKSAIVVSPKGLADYTYLLKIGGVSNEGDIVHGATLISEERAFELLSASGFDVEVPS